MLCIMYILYIKPFSELPLMSLAHPLRSTGILATHCKLRNTGHRVRVGLECHLTIAVREKRNNVR